MVDNTVLYFNATEDGTPITVQEPVRENIAGVVIEELIGPFGDPITRYGVEYQMVWRGCRGPLLDEIYAKLYPLIFEGKQNDFLYRLEVRDTMIISDLSKESDKVIELINLGKCCFDFKWWACNNLGNVDGPGFVRTNGNLTYDIKLTDVIMLEIAVELEKEYDYFLEEMEAFEALVVKGEYTLRAHK